MPLLEQVMATREYLVTYEAILQNSSQHALCRETIMPYTSCRLSSSNGYGFSRLFQQARIESPSGYDLTERVRVLLFKRNTWYGVLGDS